MSFPAAAQPYDAVVAGLSGGCRFAADCCPEAQWIIDGEPRGSQPAIAVAAAPGGTVLGLIPRNETFYVARVTAAEVSAPVAVGPDGQWHPRTLVVARNGAIYVLAQASGAEMVVIAFDANGQFTGTHPMPGAGSIDLAADQCTLWSAGDDRIRRYNVCSGTPLPDFLPGFARAVRVLPDGGALVVDGTVKRYSAAGTLVRTYTFPQASSATFGAIALAEGGTRGFAANTCFEELFSFDVESGVSTYVGRVALDGPRTIVPAHVWTAALGGSQVAVPTLSPALLIALAAVVAIAAWLRLSK